MLNSACKIIDYYVVIKIIINSLWKNLQYLFYMKMLDIEQYKY